jgi:hypothetical protein
VRRSLSCTWQSSTSQPAGGCLRRCDRVFDFRLQNLEIHSIASCRRVFLKKRSVLSASLTRRQHATRPPATFIRFAATRQPRCRRRESASPLKVIASERMGKMASSTLSRIDPNFPFPRLLFIVFSVRRCNDNLKFAGDRQPLEGANQ